MRSRKKRLLIVGVVLFLLLAAYVVSFCCLLEIGDALYFASSPGPTMIGWMSADPSLNECGYWFYWPLHRVLIYYYEGDYVYPIGDDFPADMMPK